MKKIARLAKNQYFQLSSLVLVLGVVLFGFYFNPFVVDTNKGKVAGLESTPTNSAQTQLPTPVDWKSELLRLINEERSKNKLPSLGVNILLELSANAKAKDIIAKDYWDTKNPQGQKAEYFVTNAGYKYSELGEALAKGFDNPTAVFQSLLDDIKTKENILNAKYKEIGISTEVGLVDSTSTTVIVIHFASQGSGTIALNKNKSNNTDPIVTCNYQNIPSKQLKSSECAKSTDCQIGGKWYFYQDREKCIQDQKNYYSNTYKPLPYYTPPPIKKTYMVCSLYDAETNYTTYLSLTLEECVSRQNTQSQKNTAFFNRQQEAIQLREMAQAELDKICTNIKVLWDQAKEEWYATEYNNFSSSVEAVAYISSERDYFQSQANSLGCTIILSI